ncbi:MAG: penicillin acylase family protein [Hyphomonadaceae bacterium]
MRKLWAASACLTGAALVMLSACAGDSTARTASTQTETVAAAVASPEFSAEIRRTAYGVPHIKADDMGGIGYGYGYASAQDNICEVMDRYMTVRAERARYLGPGENDANIASDLYHRRMIDTGRVEALLAGPADSPDTPSAEARRLAEGYAAGVNRYIRETGRDGIADPRCKGQPWVRDISAVDFWRHMYVGQTVDGLFRPTTSAAPPAPGQRAALPPDLVAETTGLGSNAYGIGRDFSKGGRGVLLGNPHYPWDGVNRFYRTHFIIPGDINIVGISYIGMPMIRIGHTQTLAWSNTVSTARRYGYYELALKPDDPTQYRYEGAWVPMDRATVSVEVRDGDGLKTVERTLYSTRYGPLFVSESMPWTSTHAFALRTVEVGLRDPDQYISVWRAKTVREMKQALAKYQSFRFNSTAVDSTGEALYGDLGMIPNVSRELADACTISEFAKREWRERRIPVLDGSRAACDWPTDPDSSQTGVAGASRTPHQFRTDYVLQSNDSYWLTNAFAPLTGYSPVFGDEATQRSLRTRAAHEQVERRIAGDDGFGAPKFDLESMKQVMLSNRHYGAELVRDDLVKACRASKRASLQPACEALAGWDLKVDLDSRGAHLFHLFATHGGLRFADAFDPADAVHTPARLDTADPKVLDALQAAVDELAEYAIPLDARLGDVQAETRNGVRIPIHGSAGPEGVFNVITVDGDSFEREKGWTSIRHGASWIYVVEFTDEGPKSQGFLTYSESTDPTSPHYSDQTWLYSKKGWDDLRFTDEAVEAGTLSRVSISE